MKPFLNRMYAGAVFYPTFWYNCFMTSPAGSWKWWSRLDDQVIIGARPSEKVVRELAALGVTAVINTCEEYAGPTHIYEELGIEQLHLPTVDFQPPTLKDVELGVDYIEKQVAAGKQVYIHCKAGRARSATIVICWLMKSKGMSPEEGHAFLREKRPQTLRSLSKREVVQAYYRELQESGKPPSGTGGPPIHEV